MIKNQTFNKSNIFEESKWNAFDTDDLSFNVQSIPSNIKIPFGSFNPTNIEPITSNNNIPLFPSMSDIPKLSSTNISAVSSNIKIPYNNVDSFNSASITEPLPSNNNITPIKIISRHYIPTNKITKEHIKSIIGNRNGFNEDRICKTRTDMENLKLQFSEFARDRIKKDYCNYVCSKFGWNICTFKGLKENLKGMIWNDDLAKDLYDLTYKRFYTPTYYHWDKNIEHEFCQTNGYEYDGESNNEKGCLAILATSIKNDLNKQIRSVTKQFLGYEVRRRADNNINSDKLKRKRYGHDFNINFVKISNNDNLNRKENLQNLVMELKEKLANAEKELSERNEPKISEYFYINVMLFIIIIYTTDIKTFV